MAKRKPRARKPRVTKASMIRAMSEKHPNWPATRIAASLESSGVTLANVYGTLSQDKRRNGKQAKTKSGTAQRSRMEIIQMVLDAGGPRAVREVIDFMEGTTS